MCSYIVSANFGLFRLTSLMLCSAFSKCIAGINREESAFCCLYKYIRKKNYEYRRTVHADR